MDYQQYLSHRALNLPASGIRKFWELAMATENVVSLAIGEPDYTPPQAVLDEMKHALDNQDTHYTSNHGLPELRTAISEWYNKHYHVNYDIREIMLTIGASEGIDLALRVLLNDGDEVLIPDPSYVAYKGEVLLNNGVPVMVPTYLKDGFALTVEELEKYVTPNTKALLMGFPSNPTGAILSKEQLQAIADFAIKHDIMVISDEIYSVLTYDADHHSIAALPNMKERTITLNGFSKAYAMTGLRIGYLCAPKFIIDMCIKIHQYSIVAPATPVQRAAIVAIRDCDDSIKAMREEYHCRRDLIVTGLQEMGFTVAVPQGAFYVYPDISSTGLSDEEFAIQLLQSKKVAVVPGSAFGDCGKNKIRISYASSRETIQTALRLMKEFVEELKN